MDDSKLEELKRMMAAKQQAAREEAMRRAGHEAAMNEPGLETPMVDPIDLAVLPLSAPGSAAKALGRVAGNEIGAIGPGVAELVEKQAVSKFPSLFGKTIAKEGAELGGAAAEKELAEKAGEKVVRSGPPNWEKYAQDLKNPPAPEMGLKERIAQISKKQLSSGGQKSGVPNWKKYGDEIAELDKARKSGILNNILGKEATESGAGKIATEAAESATPGIAADGTRIMSQAEQDALDQLTSSSVNNTAQAAKERLKRGF